MQLSSVLVLPIAKVYDLDRTAVMHLAINWSIYSFIIGLIIVLFLMKPDMNLQRRSSAAPIPQSVSWAIAGVFMAFASQTIAGLIETYLLGITQGSQNTADIMNITITAPLFMIIPMVIAPILEEIIFRKIIFGALYKRFNFFVAALLSAFVFGIIHGEPQHILIYAGMGFVFAFLYVKTKRIIVPIIVHMAMNSITVLALYLSPEDLEQQLREMQMIIFGG
jgi:membrane protease YdiL (CAAX protease family)